MTVVLACGSCGTRLRQGAKFCDECGTPTAADPPQYKQVTVLFADVVRSMDIAAAVDIERLREIMTELLNRSAAVVKRFGGTVEYNGDGVMALFGAPIALEDHAFRGCLAALAIQEEASRLASEVQNRDGMALQLRVGLNSGRVIAGDIGAASLGYAAIGETVGFAQRIEGAAPPGGVMVSESTARLVEHAVVLAEPEWVLVKGFSDPVCVRRVVATIPGGKLAGRAEPGMVGRRWEMAALEAIVERAINGRGGVVNVIGPAGIGKSRTAREAAAIAAGRGMEVFWTFCESHAGDVPFHAVTQLLRTATGITDLDGDAARAQLRTVAPPDADPQDVRLLEDLLGIADPDVALPQIDPDARRRRLTALINAATLARTEPALFVIEDVHWIDAVSESLLASLLTIVPRTSVMVMITARPEYDGGLTHVRGGQAIALAPLSHSDITALLEELLGTHPSVAGVTTAIADRADGNPFFAEEMVRELVEREVLVGRRGGYRCHTNAAEVNVPATVQAAIEARIDRLTAPARLTLTAASVIGARFEPDLLAALGINPVLDELLAADLIDQVRFTPTAEYSFHHPLIRTVAYESQLKTERAQWHRRLAIAIQERTPGSVDDNAALIAEHLEAAGDLLDAYAWHMRAGVWSTNRDLAAARISWQRARAIADALSGDDPEQLSLRIAPRTMLCATAWRVHTSVAGEFDELRRLCIAAGDKASLAIATTGLVMEHIYRARIRESLQMTAAVQALIESVGDPDLTVGLSLPLLYAMVEGAEWTDLLRWSQTVIDLADGDPAMGNLIIGSPLGVAYATRAIARYCIGRPKWRDDQRRALEISHDIDPVSYAAVVSFIYFLGIPCGVLRPDHGAMREIEDHLCIAERSGDDIVLANAQMTLGIALVHRDCADGRMRGRQLLSEVAEWFVRRGHNLAELPIVEIYLAREKARGGELDEAVALMRTAVDHLFREEGLLAWSPPATGVFVEALLNRRGDGDVGEAEAAIERLATAPSADGVAVRDIWLLRLRTLLARARGDDHAYGYLRGRYCATAKFRGFGGHVAWAEAMVE